MAPLTSAAGIVLTFIASAPSSSVDAFSPATTNHRHVLTSTTPSWSHSPIMLRMSEEENAEDSAGTTIEDSAEPEEKKLDPEVIALKESIASLDSDLKAKKIQLSNLKDIADKYSSAGYARQVASVENNKRLRRGNIDDDKSAARAGVLQSFLPVLDEYDVVKQKYEGNAFASTLDALRIEFENSLVEMGVSEYVVESGQSMDAGRAVAVEEEYSEEYAKGTVIRASKSGLEISGNVIRPAEVVGSLGSESVEQAEEGDSGEDGDAE